MGQMEMKCISNIGKKTFLYWPRLLRWVMWPMGLLLYDALCQGWTNKKSQKTHSMDTFLYVGRCMFVRKCNSFQALNHNTHMDYQLGEERPLSVLGSKGQAYITKWWNSKMFPISKVLFFSPRGNFGVIRSSILHIEAGKWYLDSNMFPFLLTITYNVKHQIM
jgi:hypothetical protein